MNDFFQTAIAERGGLETIHNTQRRDNSAPLKKTKMVSELRDETDRIFQDLVAMNL